MKGVSRRAGTDIAKPGKRSADQTRIFLSYAREDLAFAERLGSALEERGFEILVDQSQDHNPFLEEWRQSIHRAIVRADTILFIVSPDSASSKPCRWELKSAVSASKRLAPIFFRPVEGEALPPEVRDINAVPFKAGEDFQGQVDVLIQALNMDIDWIRQHTRLEERARGCRGGDRAGGPGTSKGYGENGAIQKGNGGRIR